MRGEVEIWRGDELLHKEGNLLVNGAGKSIVDMLTVSPSLSGISSASALLDTSNYTIQAITFGTDRTAYQNNAHYLNDAKSWFLSSLSAQGGCQMSTFALGGGASYASRNPVSVVVFKNLSAPEVFLESFVPFAPETGASSWGAVVGLSDPPNPNKTVLESSCNVSAGLYGFGTPANPHGHTGVAEDISSIIGSTGHNVNLLPRPIAQRFFQNTEISGLSGIAQSVLGCFPEGSGTADFDLHGGVAGEVVLGIGNGFSSLSSLTNEPDCPGGYKLFHGDVAVSGNYSGLINSASSMDASGFLGVVFDLNNSGVVGYRQNYNRLFYTTNIPDAPRKTSYQTYWTSSNVTVTNITETGPLGGAPVMSLSAVAEPTNWPLIGARKDTDINNSNALHDFWWDYIHKPLLPRQWRNAYRSVYSVYVKRPTFGGDVVAGEDGNSASAFYLQNADTGVDNFLYFHYPNGYESASSAVPEIRTGLDAWTGGFVEDAGGGWYRCAIVTSGLGDGYTGATVEGDDISSFLAIGGGSPYGATLTTSADQLWIAAPQFEQHKLSSDTSATPYVAVKGFGSPDQLPEAGLQVSGGCDLNNSGVVQYSITLASGDVGMSNLYGGIYTMGLWTIDTLASRQAGNSPPYSFDALDNPRKYQLFATKQLTKNLSFINDYDSTAGVNNYSDITIKWRIHFT